MPKKTLKVEGDPLKGQGDPAVPTPARPVKSISDVYADNAQPDKHHELVEAIEQGRAEREKTRP